MCLMQTRWIVQVNLRMNRTFPNVSDGTLFNRLEVYFFLDISNGTLFNRLEVYFSQIFQMVYCSTDWRSTTQSRARKIFSVPVAEMSRVPFFWSHFLSSWSQSCAKTQKFRRKKKEAIFEAIFCTHPDTNHQ